MEKPSIPKTASTTSQDLGKKPTLVKKSSFQNRKLPEIKQTLTSKYRMLKANPLLKLSLELEGKDLSSLPQSITNISLSSHKLNFDQSAKNANSNGNVNLNNTSLASFSRSKEPNIPTSKVQKTESAVGKQTKGLVRSQSLKYPAKTKDDIKNPPFKVKAFNRFTKKDTDVKNQQNGKVLNGRSQNMLNGNRPQIGDKNIVQTLKDNKPVNDVRKSRFHLAGKTITKTNGKKENQETNKVSDNKPTRRLRRSLSAQHFDRKRGKSSNPELCIARLQDTQSLEDLRPERKFVLLAPDISPIAEEVRNVSFKTPSAYERRSIIFRTPNTSRRSLLHSSVIQTPSFAPKDLRERLADWLSKMGKNVSSFHHLRCFGVHHAKEIIDEENKENIEVLQDLSKGSYEDLQICGREDSNSNSSQVELPKEEDLENVARGALADLHKLISEGYPREQCEAWLRLIQQKYKNLEQEPQYWECRAAIEQSRGNISSAVECYKTAIVQGAEIHSVDESLDQLLQKFSLLNISTNESEDKVTSKDRARIVKDARNIFKSTIIQFAVQERTLKKSNLRENEKEKKFIVTPVRRSTRMRRSAYTSTPGVKMCASLQELDSPTRKTMDFHTNNALC